MSVNVRNRLPAAVRAGGLEITFLGGGCVYVRGFEGSEIAARLEPDDEGRFEVKELYVRTLGKRVDSVAVHEIRPDRLARLLNLPKYQRRLHLTLVRPGVDFASAIAAAVDDVGGQGPGDLPIFSTRRRRRVQKQPHARTPQRFYRDVANAYRAAVELGEPPHQFISAEADVSEHTAHWWIKESRRLGYLGKAQPGRTGEAPRLRIRNIGTRTESLQLGAADEEGPTLVAPATTIDLTLDYALDLLEDEATWQPAPED